MADRIVTIATSGGDYTTFALALAGVTDDFSSTDNLIFRRTDSVRESSGFTVSGYATSNIHWVIIECNANVQHDGTRSSGAGVVGAAGWGTLVTVDISYVKFRRLEIRNTGTWGTAIRAGASPCVIDSCLLYDSQIGIDASGETSLINSIIYNCNEFGINGVPKYSYYNTILNCGTSGLNSASWNSTFHKNNYVGGSVEGADYVDGHSTSTYTTCASEDGSAGTTISVANCGFTASTAGSENANISSTSDLIGAGTNLSSDSVYPVSVDCFGNSRASTPCIGAVEYVSSVNYIPTIINNYRQQGVM